MSDILKFFKNKKKFARAGQGQVLGHKDDSKQVNEPSKSHKSPILNEVENYRKRLTQAEAQADKFKKRNTSQEEPKQLKNVHFWCPELFDDSKIGSYKEIDDAIDQYLDNELKSNSNEVHILRIIRNIEKSKFPENYDLTSPNAMSLTQLRETRFSKIQKLMENILANPGEQKFQKLRCNNAMIKDLCNIDGLVDFLKHLGFIEKKIDNEDYIIVPDDIKIDMDKLKTYLDLYSSATPILPVLYRATRIYHASEIKTNIRKDDLSDDFFTMSRDLYRIAQEKYQNAEEELMLTTALREKLKFNEKKSYKYALIRVHTQDEYIIEGVFHANDSVTKVREWVSSCIDESIIEFQLLAPPGTVKLGGNNKNLTARVDICSHTESLVELNLAPCSSLLLNVTNGSKMKIIRKELAKKNI